MQTQANRAGPGLERAACTPASSEAAGPAGPRLVIEEVTCRLHPAADEVRATLALGRQRFLGTAAGRAGEQKTWELAAAASVVAMQQCLQQLTSGPATPQVQLLDVVAQTTATGQDYIAAAVRVTLFGTQTDLLGSALVRNDRSRTAVAAALDAVHRVFGRLDGLAPRESAACSSEPHDERAARAARTSPPLEAALSDARAEDRSTGFRPRSTTDTPPPGYPAVGVAITARSIQASLVNSEGAILARTQREPDGNVTREAVLGLAIDAVRQLLHDTAHSHEVTGLGLAVDGLPDSTGGMPNASNPTRVWRDLREVEDRARGLGLPAAAITAAEAAAFAEFAFGAAAGIADILCVRVGRDIELGLLARGSPLASAHGLPINAGHLVVDSDGPQCTCGESGCWQALASTDALVARAVQAVRGGVASAISAAVDGRLSDITPSLIVRMASAGDAVARRALQETGRYLALGLANIIALFGPQAVIVESHPPPVRAALLRMVEGALKSSPRAGLVSNCVLLPAELGESAAALGAAAWAARSAS